MEAPEYRLWNQSPPLFSGLSYLSLDSFTSAAWEGWHRSKILPARIRNTRQQLRSSSLDCRFKLRVSPFLQLFKSSMFPHRTTYQHMLLTTVWIAKFFPVHFAQSFRRRRKSEGGSLKIDSDIVGAVVQRVGELGVLRMQIDIPNGTDWARTGLCT